MSKIGPFGKIFMNDFEMIGEIALEFCLIGAFLLVEEMLSRRK